MTPQMSEPEALREKDENNRETNDEDAVSKRKVLRCDLKVSRLGIKNLIHLFSSLKRNI